MLRKDAMQLHFPHIEQLWLYLVWFGLVLAFKVFLHLHTKKSQHYPFSFHLTTLFKGHDQEGL